MSQSHVPVRDEKTHDLEFRKAEERAQRAEEKIQRLEKSLAELKSERIGTVTTEKNESESPEDAVAQLRGEPMMAHLMDALEAGNDIGHYGRLVFAMVGRHFLPAEQLLEWLNQDPDFGREQAIVLVRQVNSRNYSPPRRERILAWQAQQDFPILPNADDPDCGNVYRNLKFPDKVYEHIQEYQEDKTETEGMGAR